MPVEEIDPRALDAARRTIEMVQAPKRVLAFAWPAPTPGVREILLLVEPDGTVVKRYDSAVGSYRRIEYRDRWFRNQGIDRATGERIYLPEPLGATG